LSDEQWCLIADLLADPVPNLVAADRATIHVVVYKTRCGC
jgi:hypothetical protein